MRFYVESRLERRIIEELKYGEREKIEKKITKNKNKLKKTTRMNNKF